MVAGFVDRFHHRKVAWLRSSRSVRPHVSLDEQNAANEQAPERRADSEEAHARRRNDEGGDDSDALVRLLKAQGERAGETGHESEAGHGFYRHCRRGDDLGRPQMGDGSLGQDHMAAPSLGQTCHRNKTCQITFPHAFWEISRWRTTIRSLNCIRR